MAKKDKRNKVEEAQATAVPPVDNSQQPAPAGRRVPPAKIHNNERLKNLPGSMQPPTRIPISPDVQPDAAPTQAKRDGGVAYQQPEYKDGSAVDVLPAPVQPDGMPAQAGAPQHTVAYQQPYYRDMSASRPADVDVQPDAAPKQAKRDGGVAYQQPYFRDMSAADVPPAPVQPDAAPTQAVKDSHAHVVAADDSARRAAPADPDAMPKRAAKSHAQPYTSSKPITQDKIRAMFQPDMQGEQAEMAGYRPQNDVRAVQTQEAQTSADDAKMREGMQFWQAQRDLQYKQDIEALDRQDREMRAKLTPSVPVASPDDGYRPQDDVQQLKSSQDKQHDEKDASEAAKMQAEREAVDRQFAAYNNPTQADMQALKASQQAQHDAPRKPQEGEKGQQEGKQSEPAYDPDAAYEALYRATHKMPSEEDLKKLEKKERREKIIAAVGDGISALANLIFTTKGAKSSFDPNNGLLPATNKRWKELADDRLARSKQYMDGLYNAMRDDISNKEKRDAIMRQMEQQRSENALKQEQLKLQQRQMRINEAKNERENALADLEKQYKLGQIAKTEYEAEAKKVEAQYAGKMQQAKLATESARKKSLDASATNSYASARAHNRSNTGEFEAWDEQGNVHKFKTQDAAMAYARQHGTIGTYNVASSADEISSNGSYTTRKTKTSAKTETYAKRVAKQKPKPQAKGSAQGKSKGKGAASLILTK